MAMSGLMAAALAESAIITWRDLSQTKFLPLPSDYAAVVIIYGGLSLLPGDGGARFASLFGWGLVAATFLNLWNPAAPTTLALPGSKSSAATVGTAATTVPGNTGVTGKPSTAAGPTGSGGRAGSGPQ